MTPSVTLQRKAMVLHNQSSTKKINKEREREREGEREGEMRGESMGQKEILLNYGAVENKNKKGADRKRVQREIREVCYLGTLLLNSC